MDTLTPVTVREVGLRDGLQSTARTLPTAHKIDWLRAAHAAGASGKVATDDVAYPFASMGVPTGLDHDALIALRGRVGQWLDGKTLHGRIARAGLPKTMRKGEPGQAAVPADCSLPGEPERLASRDVGAA